MGTLRARFFALLIVAAVLLVFTLLRLEEHVIKSTGAASSLSLSVVEPNSCGHYSVNCSTCALALRRGLRCGWCVTSSTCIGTETLLESCDDVEVGFCSPVLLFSIPSRHRVIYVGKRTGGPEALVQLHLALLHWSFISTHETRKRQVGRGLLPFFRDAYATEYKKFGTRMVKHHDYAAFLNSAASGDIFILTETWPCKEKLPAPRVRQLQYHLTAQDRRFTYDIAHMYIPDAKPEACGVFGHTNFLTRTFLNQSSKSTIQPYITPHIVSRAQTFLAKALSSPSERQPFRDVVLYDGDARFDVSKIDPDLSPLLVKAASIKPEALYQLFERALCVIDFEMPGAERLVLEGSLFGAAILINDEWNGNDRSDFPIPEQYRIHGRNYTRVNEVLRSLVNLRNRGHWRRVLQEFAPLRADVLSGRRRFLRQVRQYFSDSVEFRLFPSSADEPAVVCLWLAAALTHLPLALVTVTFASRDALQAFLTTAAVFVRQLSTLYVSASVEFTVGTLGVGAIRRDTPRATLFVADVVAPLPHCFIASYDFLGIVAVAFDGAVGQDEHRVLRFANCFIVHRPTAAPSLLVTHGSQVVEFSYRDNDCTATSVDELQNLKHLSTDSLWQRLSSSLPRNRAR